MPVRSGVLARWHSIGGVLLSPLFVVPLTDSWLVKQLDLLNSTAAPITVRVIGANAGGAEFIYPINQIVAASAVFEWQGWLALGPGDTLQFQASAAGMYFWASGADLPGHL